MKRTVLLLVSALGMFLMTASVTATPLAYSDMANTVPEWPVSTSEAGGRFILSDCPEDVQREGILYQDKVKGDVRLFFHHVNVMPGKKRIMAMVFNTGNQTAKLEVLRYGVSGPDPDFLRAGRAIQGDYLNAAQQHKLDIPPGKSATLPMGKNGASVSPQMIMTGMIDFRTDQEVRLVIAAIAEKGDAATLVSQSALLPPAPGKPHLRGTFLAGDRVLIAQRIYDPGMDGPVAITLGDGEIDPFLLGQDVTTGQMVQNQGNYGVVYRILIPTTGKGKIRCFLNPRGGVYAGWAAVKTKSVHRVVGTPSRSLYFGDATLSDFEMIAEFPAGESLWVTLSPPGASNLPVRLMLVPAT